MSSDGRGTVIGGTAITWLALRRSTRCGVTSTFNLYGCLREQIGCCNSLLSKICPATCLSAAHFVLYVYMQLAVCTLYNTHVWFVGLHMHTCNYNNE